MPLITTPLGNVGSVVVGSVGSVVVGSVGSVVVGSVGSVVVGSVGSDDEESDVVVFAPVTAFLFIS